jgi:FtsH-binding integral membrane protein
MVGALVDLWLGLLKSWTRTTSFIGKEIIEVVRRPGALFSMIFGPFLIMGVFGLIIAMIANMIIQSSGLAMAIPFLGVLIFAGLTAYDTQMLKQQYYTTPREFAGKAVVLGALNLYLDFINMFLFLLRFMGSSRN